MIERMPKIWLSKIRILSRLSNTSSKSIHSPIYSSYRSRRFYANYNPNNLSNPPQPNPQQLPYNIHQAPTQQLRRNPSGNHVPFPTYFQPPPPPPKRKRSLRPYIYAAISFAIGGALGLKIRETFMGLPCPDRHTPQDAMQTKAIQEAAALLPIVRFLSQDPAWRAWDAYSIFPAEVRERRLTSGPLGGARGIGGYQRVFCNESTGEFVTVVFIGGAVTGWPRVIHGGLVATLLDESMGRCAIVRFPARTGVTANLNITYRKPAAAHRFYVVRCRPVKEGSTERKGFVKGTLETEDGQVLAEAEGLFVQPKILETASLVPLESSSNVGF